MSRRRIYRKALFATARWLWHNRRQSGGWRDLRFPLLALALERGDLHWPGRTGRWIRGAAVLDVGCGRNLQSIGFLAEGVRRYVGIDPVLTLDSAVFKDSRARWSERQELAFSPAELMALTSRISFARQSLAETAEQSGGQFDAIVMHNVTEHMMDLPGDLRRCATLLRPGGVMVFRHPNYYCWHGHHLKPRTISEIDPDDAEQAAVCDWAHVRFDPQKHEWIGRTQNRIRLDELRALVSTHFSIERWEETESPPEQGRARLTPEILQRHPEFTERELAVKCAFVVARKI